MASVTVKSAQECLDEHGSMCPVAECRSTSVRVTAEPGTDSECSKEHYVCRDCNTEWTAYLYAAQITTIMLGETGRRYYSGIGEDGIIEPGAFLTIPCPKGPVAEALKDFLRQMKFGSVRKKGEALARLAHLARVDLNSLSGNPPVEPPTPPSGTE